MRNRLFPLLCPLLLIGQLTMCRAFTWTIPGFSGPPLRLPLKHGLTPSGLKMAACAFTGRITASRAKLRACWYGEAGWEPITPDVLEAAGLRTGGYDTCAGGATMATEEQTIAELLKTAGYRTGAFGKWHLVISLNRSKLWRA